MQQLFCQLEVMSHHTDYFSFLWPCSNKSNNYVRNTTVFKEAKLLKIYLYNIHDKRMETSASEYIFKLNMHRMDP